jgi:microcystin-dependent protein
VGIVNNVLGELINTELYEQFGTMTPDDMRQVFLDMWDVYMSGDYCEVGKIEDWSINPSDLPPNRLVCDGSVYQRVDYPRLYDLTPPARILNADWFEVPDLRNLFVVGSGDEYTLEAKGGAAQITLLESHMPEHTHTAQPHFHTSPEHAHTSPAHSHTAQPHSHLTQPHGHWYDKAFPNVDVEGPGVPDPLGLGLPFIPTLSNIVTVVVDPATVTLDSTAAAINPTATAIDPETVTIDNAGGGQEHENRPPYFALLKVIVAS